MTDMVSTEPDRRGRAVKFTPERLEQIRNLVERGLRRDEIAETIGVTVNSLAVTCSNKGISLRRARQEAAVREVPPPEPPKTNGNGPTVFKSFPLPQIVLILKYRGQERRFDLSLAADVITRLVLEAQFTDKTLGEVVAQRIMEGGK